MSSDIIHGILVMLTLPALLQALSFLRKRFKIDSELSRKTVHVGMGLLATSFPWLFKSPVVVDLLAVVMIGLLAMLRFRPLNPDWKNVLCNTERKTYGEFFFSIGIVALFNLAHQSPILYCVPLLILSIADALSALVGMTYGRRKYHTLDGSKSAEGSLVFFQAAFLSTLIPLLLITNTGRIETLLIAFIVGILAMLFEAIAWRGLDNLFIPLGTYFALKTHLSAAPEMLFVRLIVLATIVIALLVAKRCTTLNGSAVLGVALYCYYAWMLGGTAWLFMPIIVFASYTMLLPQRFRNLHGRHSLYAVISVASSGLLWLAGAALFGPERFLFPYTLAFAMHEAIIAMAHMPARHLSTNRLVCITRSSIKSWLLLFAPLLAFTGLTVQSIVNVLVAPLCITLAVLIFYVMKAKPHKWFHYTSPDSLHRWAQQTALVIVTSSIGLLPCFHLFQ